MHKISVIGMGYVGISNAILLSQKHEVSIFDKDKNKINLIKNKISPIDDPDIIDFLKNRDLKLSYAEDLMQSVVEADFVIMALPTNFDESINAFDTSIIENVICDTLNFNPEVTIVIKSTIPTGLVDKLRIKFNTQNILFSPEFLREGQALHDNLFPSRVIIGDKSEKAKLFGEIVLSCIEEKDTPFIYTNPKEAESIKLFANTYLALRISFFNEIDTFAESLNLDSNNIIRGISLDERIGDYYNNPSFGYGGYCLPKDTKQLLHLFKNIPQETIEASIDSNLKRKEFILQQILNKQPKSVGVYRVTMKANSDNFRSSAVWDLIHNLIEKNIEVIIYEPSLDSDEINSIKVEPCFENFKKNSELIIANRYSNELDTVKEKVYSRDIYNRD